MGLLTAPPEQQGAGRVVYLWPENLATWRTFMELQSQWRVGASGASGLDYAGVRAHLCLAGVPPREQRAMWPGLQACEAAVLQVWEEERRRQREEQENRRSR